MATYLTTAEATRYTPWAERAKPEDERVVVRLRTPTKYDKAALRRNAREKGARPVSWAEVKAEIVEGLRVLEAHGYAAEDASAGEMAAMIGKVDGRVEYLRREIETLRGACADVIDEACDEAGRPRPAPDEETQAHIDAHYHEIEELGRQAEAIQAIVSEHVPRVAQTIAAYEYWCEVARLEAVRLFVVGAENMDLGEVGPRGLSEAQLELFTDEQVGDVGNHCFRLFTPSETEKKSSSSP